MAFNINGVDLKKFNFDFDDVLYRVKKFNIEKDGVITTVWKDVLDIYPNTDIIWTAIGNNIAIDTNDPLGTFTAHVGGGHKSFTGFLQSCAVDVSDYETLIWKGDCLCQSSQGFSWIYLYGGTSEGADDVFKTTLADENNRGLTKSFDEVIDVTDIDKLYLTVKVQVDSTDYGIEQSVFTKSIIAVSPDKTFEYTGDIQRFTPSISGDYLLEVLGAQGGSCNTGIGGKGGYSSGIVYLEKGQTVFVVVGGQGEGSIVGDGTVLKGGYNGGGEGKTGWRSGFSGGGATHIATETGVLSSLVSNKSAVLIVAGGGGGACNSNSNYANGGTGGGLTGGKGSDSNTNGGSQTEGGKGNYTNIGTFGQGGNHWDLGGAGGGGWYGGAGENAGYSGSGGSGYIDGVDYGATRNGIRTGDGYAKITLIEGYKVSDRTYLYNGEDSTTLDIDGEFTIEDGSIKVIVGAGYDEDDDCYMNINNLTFSGYKTLTIEGYYSTSVAYGDTELTIKLNNELVHQFYDNASDRFKIKIDISELSDENIITVYAFVKNDSSYYGADCWIKINSMYIE